MLEFGSVVLRVFVKRCKKLRWKDEKECLKLVVRVKWFRGGPIPTRFGTLVVWRESSCLEGITKVGMDDSGSGSEN